MVVELGVGVGEGVGFGVGLAVGVGVVVGVAVGVAVAEDASAAQAWQLEWWEWMLEHVLPEDRSRPSGTGSNGPGAQLRR